MTRRVSVFLYLPSAFACLLLVYVVSVGILNVGVRTAVLVILVVVHGVILQWVNARWITASHLTEQIALEVGRADPERTAILNLPDNFRGAYVFRRGLDDATTLFLGQEPRAPFRKMLLQNLNGERDVSEARLESTTVVITLPNNLRSEVGWRVKTTQNIVLIDTVGPYPGVLSFLSFRSALSNPMMGEVRWRRASDSSMHPDQLAIDQMREVDGRK